MSVLILINCAFSDIILYFIADLKIFSYIYEIFYI